MAEHRPQRRRPLRAALRRRAWLAGCDAARRAARARRRAARGGAVERDAAQGPDAERRQVARACRRALRVRALRGQDGRRRLRARAAPRGAAACDAAKLAAARPHLPRRGELVQLVPRHLRALRLRLGLHDGVAERCILQERHARRGAVRWPRLRHVRRPLPVRVGLLGRAFDVARRRGGALRGARRGRAPAGGSAGVCHADGRAADQGDGGRVARLTAAPRAAGGFACGGAHLIRGDQRGQRRVPRLRRMGPACDTLRDGCTHTRQAARALPGSARLHGPLALRGAARAPLLCRLRRVPDVARAPACGRQFRVGAPLAREAQHERLLRAA
mmetsp:Transcript_630/g.1902  ORF Transcript_630/g.1902 Transcript_630/m.1902 type:complete len:331 (+) Transcript_630:104-1096(+)